MRTFPSRRSSDADRFATVLLALFCLAAGPASAINIKIDLNTMVKQLRKRPDSNQQAASVPAPDVSDATASGDGAATGSSGKSAQSNPADQSQVPPASGFKLAGDGLRDTYTLLEKACTNPLVYAEKLQLLGRLATGADAKASQLVDATPRRNAYQVILTDTAVHEAYYPEACERVQRLSSCKVGATVTAEQACDCGAGYPGEVESGIGAGELILRSSRSFTPAACRQAVAAASPAVKSRFTAQLGRALVYSNEPGGFAEGVKALNDAKSMGYSRADVDLARATLRKVEFEGASVDLLTGAISDLRVAKSKGAKDADMVLKSMNEVAAAHHWSQSFYRAFTAALNTATPQSSAPDCKLVPSS